MASEGCDAAPEQTRRRHGDPLRGFPEQVLQALLPESLALARLDSPLRFASLADAQAWLAANAPDEH